MRRLASILVSSALASFVCAIGTPAAHATLRGFEGSLSVSLGNLGRGVTISYTASAVGSADVTLNSAGIDQFEFPAGAFQLDGVERPLPYPDAFPLTSISLDARTGAGGFGGLTTSSGVGFMPIEGAFFLGYFGNPIDPPIFLTLPTEDEDDIGIGVAGVFDFYAGVNITGQLQANDWTTDSVTNGLGTFSGFLNGDSMRLVSPFVYQLTQAGNPFVPFPGVAILDVHFVEPVPEPGTAVLLASGILLLGGRERAARRGGAAKTRC